MARTLGYSYLPKGAEMINVSELSGRAGIDRRAIRYVLDHEVVAGVKKDTESRGAPRVFEPEEATAVAVAALLLQAGLKRRFVQGFVRGLFTPHGGSGPSVVGQWLRGEWEPADRSLESLEIGERSYVRLIAGSNASSSGWRDLRTGRPAAEDYVPLTIVRIDLRELRRRLREE